MLRLTKIALVLAVALYGLAAAFHNLIDWKGTLEAVGSATAMVTFDGGAESWQATSNPVLIWAGALFILFSKLTGALLCLLGANNMWRVRSADIASFGKAKELALAGCGVLIFMLFAGFVVVAETWFELWRSDILRGPVLGSAFRYAGIIGIVAVFVAMREE